jgi:hypothetical protein
MVYGLLSILLYFSGSGSGAGVPDPLVLEKWMGVSGGVVEAHLAEIDIVEAQAPNLAISRKNHARLCLRARDLRGQHGYGLYGV